MDNIPRVETIRGLLENSGNQCAFPGCNHPVLNHRNQFIAKLSYLSVTLDVNRNSQENLMFLCYRHYVETQDSITYPLEILKSIKENHENSTFVESSSRFQLNTIASIQESMNEQETEDEQRELLDSAVTLQSGIIDIQPDQNILLNPSNEPDREDELLKAIEIEANEDEEYNESIKALSEEMEESFDTPSNLVNPPDNEQDIIQIPESTTLSYRGNSDSQPRKINRIAFKNSDSKRLQLQLTLLKTQVNELFGMLDILKQSDNDLNKDLKTMVTSLDILGIFHHRFSKLSFRRNPFINRNYNKVHARIPKLKHALDGLINTLESIAGGKQDTSVQNIKEAELPQIDRPTTRILIKSIRYADQIAN